MRPDVRTLASDPAFEHGLLLIRGRRHPDWASAVVYNPLRTDGPAPLMAWDRGDSTRAKLLAQFPGRPVWLVDGPSLTGGAYRVVAGPFDASNLPAAADTAAQR